MVIFPIWWHVIFSMSSINMFIRLNQQNRLIRRIFLFLFVFLSQLPQATQNQSTENTSIAPPGTIVLNMHTKCATQTFSFSFIFGVSFFSVSIFHVYNTNLNNNELTYNSNKQTNRKQKKDEFRIQLHSNKCNTCL